MARKTRNLGMWFALGIGAFYLWKQYRAKQVALPAPGASVSQAAVQSSSSPVS